jgi:hypothetical protein
MQDVVVVNQSVKFMCKRFSAKKNESSCARGPSPALLHVIDEVIDGLPTRPGNCSAKPQVVASRPEAETSDVAMLNDDAATDDAQSKCSKH